MENLRRIWLDAGAAARTGLLLGALLIAALVAWGVHAVLKSDDQVLFADLDPQDAATIAAELERMKQPYRLNADGTTILVDREQVHAVRMKLMGKGVNLRGGVGFEIFNDNDFGTTDFAQRINYQRALQGELTRTIGALEAVRDVRVHLVMPESGLFRKSGVKPKAAVTLAMKRGQTLGAAQVLGIQRLVAAAVPEIEAGAVTIVDEHGITLSRPLDADGIDGTEMRFGAKSDIEQYFTRKAVAVLDKAFGPGRAIVTVDVTLDHNQVSVTREDVLPGNPRAAEGAPTRRRTTSSVPNGEGDAMRGGSSTSEVEYQNGRRVEQVVSRPGSIKQISVGILLPQKLAPERADELKAVISASLGLNGARGDDLAISSLDNFAMSPAAAASGGAVGASPMSSDATPAPAAPAAPAPTTNGLGWLWWLVLVGALVVSAGAWLARRREAAAETPAEMSNEARERLLAQVRQWLAEEHPQADDKRRPPPEGVRNLGSGPSFSQEPQPAAER